MVIDVHAHIFPEGLAPKASRAIGSFYEMPMRYDGRVSTLLQMGRRSGVDKFVVSWGELVDGVTSALTKA